MIFDNFEVLEESDKVAGEDPAQFGYMSYHYICRFKPEHAGPRYDSIKHMKFEIQCRTILMDAWASVSHLLAYKGEASVPSHLRRDFNALSGLFYVADQHFEIFANAAQEVEQQAGRDLSDDGADKSDEVSLESVLAVLKQVFPDRKFSRDGVGLFTEAIITYGHTSITGLQSALLTVRDSVLEFEKEVYKASPTGGPRFAGAVLANIAMAFVDEEYRKANYSESGGAAIIERWMKDGSLFPDEITRRRKK